MNALQIQVSRDYAHIWGTDATLVQIPKGDSAPAGSWQMVLLDSSDQAGALGYHDLTADGMPIAKPFIKTDIENGAIWSVTVSHELLEMLTDPWIFATVFFQTTNTAGKIYPLEVCDAPEADVYAYDINGVKVSDFVYPAWFGIPGTKSKLCHSGRITKPFQLLPGGYISEFDISKGTGWKQVTAEHETSPTHQFNFTEGSRRSRRHRGSTHWKLSTL